jgi:diaminopimelate decarboxylase
MFTAMKPSPPGQHRESPHSTLDPASYTPHFAYRPTGRGGSRNQLLRCESVPLEKIATAVGTPAYVYSRASIESAYRRLDRALASLPHSICYAVKANSNLSVLRVLAHLGSNFDIVSGGELDRLRRIGVPGARIVFSGVGKTREEIRAALRYRPGTNTSRRAGIFLFNIESPAELEVLASEAARHIRAGGAPPAAAIRINPDILAGGHRHISTGRREHKFGIEWTEARRLYLAHKNSRFFTWRGISAHIGSQILTVDPFRRTIARLASCFRELSRAGIALNTIDIGGGFGIRYTNEKPFDAPACARALARIIRPLGCRLLLEPGRSIVGPAGVLLTRVLYVKETRGKRFVVVDAAMNDLIRPVLYDAIQPITRTSRGPVARPMKRVDVVGPVCETGDFLARDWPLEDVAPGELLAVWATGAYGFVEASNYNARPRPAEVLVNGTQFRVVRHRESLGDLVRGEL